MQYYDELGRGMSRPAIPHQRIIRKILTNWYLLTGNEAYEVVPGLGIIIKAIAYDGRQDKFERVPDIAFVKPSEDRVIVAIEIVKSINGSLREIACKIQEYQIYGMEEVYVYNHTSKINAWKEVRFNLGETELHESDLGLSSQVLGIHPSILLNMSGYPDKRVPFL